MPSGPSIPQPAVKGLYGVVGDQEPAHVTDVRGLLIAFFRSDGLAHAGNLGQRRGLFKRANANEVGTHANQFVSGAEQSMVMHGDSRSEHPKNLAGNSEGRTL